MCQFSSTEVTKPPDRSVSILRKIKPPGYLGSTQTHDVHRRVRRMKRNETSWWWHQLNTFALRCSKKGSCSAIKQRQFIVLHDYSWIDQSIFQNLWKLQKEGRKVLRKLCHIESENIWSWNRTKEGFDAAQKVFRIKYWAEQPVSDPKW